MTAHRRSLKTQTQAFDKWKIVGVTLGLIWGFLGVMSGGTPLFPYSVIIDRIAQIVAGAAFGGVVTDLCRPTRRALIGAVVLPILLIAIMLLTSGIGSVSLIDGIRWIILGALAGILVATAWLGALVGTVIMAIFIIVVAPIVRGSIGWGWIFIPLGTLAGAWLELDIKKLRKPGTSREEIPAWLQKQGDTSSGREELPDWLRNLDGKSTNSEDNPDWLRHNRDK